MHLFFETGAQTEVVYKVIIVLILSKKRFKKPISSYINYYRGSFQRKFRTFLIEKDKFVRKREFCHVFRKYFNHDNSLTFYNILINLHYWSEYTLKRKTWISSFGFGLLLLVVYWKRKRLKSILKDKQFYRAI